MQWSSKFVATETFANCLESCASIMCRLLFAEHPPAALTLGRPTTALSRILSNTTPVHDTVEAELSHKHHPIIQIIAGPIHLIYGSPLQ